jgi:hypothetical protein
MSNHRNRLLASGSDIAAFHKQVNEKLDALVKLAEVHNAASFTIPHFCKRNNLSESQYHKLRREGRGPRTMSTGSVGVRISRESEADWIRAREAEATRAPT